METLTFRSKGYVQFQMSVFFGLGSKMKSLSMIISEGLDLYQHFEQYLTLRCLILVTQLFTKTGSKIKTLHNVLKIVMSFSIILVLDLQTCCLT